MAKGTDQIVERAAGGVLKKKAGMRNVPLATKHPTLKAKVEQLERFINAAENWTTEIEEQLEARVNGLDEAMLLNVGRLTMKVDLLITARFGTWRQRREARKTLRAMERVQSR